MANVSVSSWLSFIMRSSKSDLTIVCHAVISNPQDESLYQPRQDDRTSTELVLTSLHPPSYHHQPLQHQPHPTQHLHSRNLLIHHSPPPLEESQPRDHQQLPPQACDDPDYAIISTYHHQTTKENSPFNSLRLHTRNNLGVWILQMTMLLEHFSLNNGDLARTVVAEIGAVSWSMIVLLSLTSAGPGKDAFEAVFGRHC